MKACLFLFAKSPKTASCPFQICYNPFMLIEAKPIVDKLEDLRNKRKCNCSGQKILERAYFDIVIADVRMMIDKDGMIDTESAVSELEKTRSQIKATRRETQIRYNVYEYAIRIIRSYEKSQG